MCGRIAKISELTRRIDEAAAEVMLPDAVGEDAGGEGVTAPRMHPNAQLLDSFYRAFARLDADAMVACYAEDVHFSDPVCPDLRGPAAGAMWRMLCGRAADLQIVHDGVEADDASGRAHWVARYTFSSTGRPVVNDIQATFQFRGGRIVRHQDQFDLWKWTRQALGPTGVFLGWTPAVQNKVRGQAAAGLEKFMKRA